MPLQICIANIIGRNIQPGFPPPGSDEIITQQSIQMVDEATSEDLITE
jgi:hypothetical protein